jgi:hypothetical protein
MAAYKVCKVQKQRLSINTVRVTLAIPAFAIRVLAYPHFYLSSMSSINILSAATVEAATQAHLLRAHFHRPPF